MIFFQIKLKNSFLHKRGRKHILYLIRELLSFEPGANVQILAMRSVIFTNAVKRHCSAFVISDFIAPNFTNDLIIANRKHDLATIRIYDPREKDIPDVGLIRLSDAESG